jgi:alpha-ketoglutaric semialdehyde dehydrogenase
MIFTGANFIGYKRSAEGGHTFRAFDPASNRDLDGNFSMATTAEFENALALAHSAYPIFSKTSTAARAEFLDAIASEIMALDDDLLQRCSAESGLPIGRITGERGRTCGQLKMFAQLIRDGWYIDARIDTADAERQPLPKSDIRRMLIPIGPVAVFGASNFPLAFSTAGGDTASALAAGCPVVVKAHSSHPGTNELISSAIIIAAKKTGMPEGVFSSLYLSHHDVIKLVEHPVITAVGFTGSRGVGMRLYNAAVNRPVPIPVYAEMSAVNPVVLMQGALHDHKDKLAKDLAASVNLGAGQFCTNPGLVLAVDSSVTQLFLSAYATNIQTAVPQTMLNRNICKAYAEGIASLQNVEGSLTLLAQSNTEAVGYQARPAVYTVTADDFKKDKRFAEEIFGPYNLIVLCKDGEQLLDVLNDMEGQLTATIHATRADDDLVKPVIDAVTKKAGRVIYGGFPTGVEVCHAMQHGGPFPSTTDGRSTSVGTAAVYRFLRPVAYQDVPDHLLPDILKNANPLKALRLLDGVWTNASVA